MPVVWSQILNRMMVAPLEVVYGFRLIRGFASAPVGPVVPDHSRQAKSGGGFDKCPDRPQCTTSATRPRALALLPTRELHEIQTRNCDRHCACRNDAGIHRQWPVRGPSTHDNLLEERPVNDGTERSAVAIDGERAVRAARAVKRVVRIPEQHRQFSVPAADVAPLHCIDPALRGHLPANRSPSGVLWQLAVPSGPIASHCGERLTVTNKVLSAPGELS